MTIHEWYCFSQNENYINNANLHGVKFWDQVYAGIFLTRE